MRLLVAADVHGAYDRLAAALRPDDVLLSLGDHLNIIDYKDLSGILTSFFPRETIEAVFALIRAGKTAEARQRMIAETGSIPNLFQRIGRAAHEAYFRMFAGIGCRAYFIYGNVDFPDALRANLHDNHTLCEAEMVEIEGRRFGLVSGQPPGPYAFGMPGEVTREAFAQRLHEIGAVEVLAVHPPPAIEGMSIDTVAERDEGGNPDVVYYARMHRPRLVLFGHVHQPYLAEHTDREIAEEPIRYLNVGCFRDTGRLLQIDPRTLATTWLNVP